MLLASEFGGFKHPQADMQADMAKSSPRFGVVHAASKAELRLCACNPCAIKIDDLGAVPSNLAPNIKILQ